MHLISPTLQINCLGGFQSLHSSSGPHVEHLTAMVKLVYNFYRHYDADKLIHKMNNGVCTETQNGILKENAFGGLVGLWTN